MSQVAGFRQVGEPSPLPCDALQSRAACEPVVVTGVSLGLPNELRNECSVFDQRNFQRIFGGENFISQLTANQKQRILDQNVVQVLKIDGQRVKKLLSSPSEVIGLASRLGKFDLVKEYGGTNKLVMALRFVFTDACRGVLY